MRSSHRDHCVRNVLNGGYSRGLIVGVPKLHGGSALQRGCPSRRARIADSTRKVFSDGLPSGFPRGEIMHTCMMCTSPYVKANGDISCWDDVGDSHILATVYNKLV